MTTSSRALRIFVSTAFAMGFAAHVTGQFDPAYCQQINGTLNIHWRAVVGPFAPCVGIEFTDGTFADASDGTVTMSGTGVSDPSCIGAASYTFTVSFDGLTLSGTETMTNVPMTLTRGPNDACFVGDWISGPHVYRAHISAVPFLCANTTASPIAGCSQGHHALGGPAISATASPTTADVTIDGTNLAGSLLCGLMLGRSVQPVPLSLIGSMTPNAALCINPFATIRCNAPSVSTQFVIPINGDPALCGLVLDVQFVDWSGTGLDFGTSRALRLTIGG